MKLPSLSSTECRRLRAPSLTLKSNAPEIHAHQRFPDFPGLHVVRDLGPSFPGSRPSDFMLSVFRVIREASLSHDSQIKQK